MLIYDRAGQNHAGKEHAAIAFIHVPKNGGKSIRQGLDAQFALNLGCTAADLGITPARLADDLASGDGVQHPVLGQIKLEHLPLIFWQEHFARTFAAFRSCQSFILVRNPRDRFLSAVMQRLGEFKDMTALRADDPAVTQEALQMCDWLAGRGAFCDIEYAHFARQTDYADLAGVRQVSAIFPIERAYLAQAWVADKTGKSVAVKHDHARREPKAWAKSFQPAVRFVGRYLIPPPIKRAVYPWWRQSAVFDDAAKRYKTIPLDTQVERFVAEYYAADVALYNEAHAAPGQPALTQAI